MCGESVVCAGARRRLLDGFVGVLGLGCSLRALLCSGVVSGQVGVIQFAGMSMELVAVGERF